jgi:CheY-specific phosphatase CheX
MRWLAMSKEASHVERIEAIAADACESLFADYGVRLERIVGNSEEPLAFLICAVIGFSGKHIRGTLVLASTQELLDRASPLRPLVQTRDWIGELANQLLGRAKNQLLRYGVEIYLNLPALLRGEHLAPVPRKALNPMRFQSERTGLGLWVEIELGANFHMSDTPNDGESGPPSGETLIF